MTQRKGVNKAERAFKIRGNLVSGGGGPAGEVTKDSGSRRNSYSSREKKKQIQVESTLK